MGLRPVKRKIKFIDKYEGDTSDSDYEVIHKFVRKEQTSKSPKKRARFERDYQEQKLVEEGAKVRAPK